MSITRYSEEDLTNLTNNTVMTTLRLWELFGDTHEHLGKTWYPDANAFATRLGRLYEKPTRDVAAGIAVLSPQCGWMDNMIDVIKVLEGHEDSYMSLGANIWKAWRILHEGEEPWEVLGGKKVLRFWYAIWNPWDTSGVVLDTHMARMFGIEPQHLFGLKGVYEAVEKGVLAASNILSKNPNTVQATLWVAGRGRKAHPIMKGSK